MSKNNALKSTIEELKMAKEYPNGWVYRISESYGTNENVPPEAIV